MAETSKLEFGIGALSLENLLGAPRVWHKRYEDAIHQTKRAEALGFESVWFAEHHHVYSGYLPAQFPIFAACAAATKTIRVCGGVTLLPVNGAERLSDGCAAVDSIAPGRLRLGLALGYAEREYLAFGTERKKRAPVFEEQLGLLLGKYADRVGKTELWVGAHADAAMKRAARYDLSLFIQQIFDPVEMRRVKDMCAEEQMKTNGKLGRQKFGVHNVIWANKDKGSQERALGRWQEMLTHYGTHIMKDSGDVMATGVTFVPRQSYLIGTPQEVVDGCAELITKGGADGIMFHIQTSPAQRDEVDEQMEIIAKEVIPHLRGLK